MDWEIVLKHKHHEKYKFGGLLLGCNVADFEKHILILQYFEICKMYARLHRSKSSVTFDKCFDKMSTNTCQHLPICPNIWPVCYKIRKCSLLYLCTYDLCSWSHIDRHLQIDATIAVTICLCWNSSDCWIPAKSSFCRPGYDADNLESEVRVREREIWYGFWASPAQTQILEWAKLGTDLSYCPTRHHAEAIGPLAWKLRGKLFWLF